MENQPEGAYLAKPSGSCCLKGIIHEGESKGDIIKIAGIETYLSRPREENANGRILLYFPDVWGLFPNGLLVMDGFADAGYLVAGPDYFRGDPISKHREHRLDTKTEPEFDYEAWKQKHTTFANDNVPKWIKAVQEQFGTPDMKYACVGYCFGAPYVCNELADGGISSAGAFAHPAFLKDFHFENLTKPVFLSCSELDHTFPTESRNKAVEMMKAGHKKYHLQLFSGVEHGFALRGNPEDPYERWVKEQSIRGIVDWFDFWLSRPGGN